MEKENKWLYKDLQMLQKGLQPGSKQFQYFFAVSEGGGKKCNYCVWMDEKPYRALLPLRILKEIVSLKREEWSTWVKEKNR